MDDLQLAPFAAELLQPVARRQWATASDSLVAPALTALLDLVRSKSHPILCILRALIRYVLQKGGSDS